MRPFILFFGMLFFTAGLSAQPNDQPFFSKLVKVTAADSALVLPERIQQQLNKTLQGKKQKNLKLFVKAANKNTGLLVAKQAAARQGQQLLLADLTVWLDKYTGETEKHLDLLLQKAAAGNCILFFDEADALFGKRGSDGGEEKAGAVALLLDKLSGYKGAVILSCTGVNCRSNVELPLFVQVKAD